MPTANPTHLSSIADIANEAFVGVAITPDAAAEAALATHYAPHVRVTEIETTTTAHLTRGDFQAFIQTLCTQFTDRKLLSATFVLATPADTTNKTGAVAVSKKRVVLRVWQHRLDSFGSARRRSASVIGGMT
ncbi:hypothetical protein B0H13DRAFT_2345206 [Mycena leptocephala]|nr:hypothetical protein B0H13DRAFT_2345206 [Mycena leptocephala]